MPERWEEFVLTESEHDLPPLPRTRKEILEADAQEAIDRERAEHVPRHMVIIDEQVPFGEKERAVVEDYIERRVIEEKRSAAVADVREAISRYFDGLHASTWGRGFDLTTNKEAAIDFLLTDMTAVAKIVNEMVAAPEPEPVTCRPGKIILVGPNINRLYRYAKERGFNYSECIKITSHSDAKRIRGLELDREVDQVFYLGTFPSHSEAAAIINEIKARYRPTEFGVTV